MFSFKSLGLQKRIMLYVTAGLVVLLGVFSFFAWRTIQQGTQVILRERLSVAQGLATQIDLLLQHTQAEFERHAAFLNADLTGELSPEEEASLLFLSSHLQEFHRFRLPVGLLLTDAKGAILWSNKESASPPEAVVLRPLTSPVPNARRTEITVVENFRGQELPVIWLSAVIGPPDGVPQGTLATAFLPTVESPTLAPFWQQGERHMEPITSAGKVVLSSTPENVSKQSPHLALVGKLLGSKKSGVRTHPLPQAEGQGSDHVISFAPLSQLPWGVVMEEKGDVALALPSALQRQVLLLSGMALLAGLLLAWFTTRQVVRPLAQLADSCWKIARGDLETPITVAGQDEVGELAKSFETMRTDLRRSLERIESSSRELEQRVKERTRELEERNQERSILLEKVIGAQEEERKRLARELHDEVGQALTALVMSLGGVEQVLHRDPEKAEERLVSLRDLTSGTLKEVRRLVSALRPSLLDDMGLVPALRWYADTYLEQAGVRTALEASGFKRRLPPHIEVAIFRVVQEAANNIVRHSRANMAEIRLEATAGVIRGSIRDNGAGFNLAGMRPEVSTGLLGMEERITLLGGVFQIESKPGNGTQVHFEIPYDGEESSGKDQGADS